MISDFLKSVQWIFIFTVAIQFFVVAALEQNALILSVKAHDGDGAAVSIEDEPEGQGVSSNVFIPTNEWQPVKPGQAIPKGLHVRLNMATGEKEAKLLDNTKEDNMKYWETDNGKKGMVNADGSKTFTRSQLKHALKKFESESEVEAAPDNTAAESVASKFRSYEELKKDLEQLRLQVKSDLEIMTDLLIEFKQPETSDERKLKVLEDLEYLVHQIDNAQNFVDMDGFTLMSQLLNSTIPNFRKWAAFIVGSATQSNPKVQIAALENGILHHLIRALQNEHSSDIRRKYIFALSAILRQFPYAQKKFLQLGGFDVFTNILQETPGDERSKLKIITLISDLLIERQEIAQRVSTYTSTSPIQHEKEMLAKFKQYSEIPLTLYVVDGSWCRLVVDLLVTPELDSQEKLLRAMHAMFIDCESDFRQFKHKLRTLEENYRAQLKSDSDNEYVLELLSLVKQILSKLDAVKNKEQF